MHEPSDTAMPPALRRLWHGRSAAEVPQRPALTVERIVGAAIELADADGLEAVAMGRVAQHLGFKAMSLYRHVRNKHELLTLMVDAAVGRPTTATNATAPTAWRPALERWSRDLLAVIRRHPWLLDVPLAAPPMGPNRLAWLDHGLRALATTELTEREKAATILLLNDYVFSAARRNTGHPPPDQDAQLSPADDPVAYAALMTELVDEQTYPALHVALQAGIFDPDDNEPETDFIFGLQRLLDGIQALIDD